MSEHSALAKAEENEGTSAKRKREGGSKKSSRETGASFNLNEIRELAELVDEHGFTDFEFENENIRVRLSKSAGMPPVAYPPYPAPAYSPAPAATAPKADTAETPAAAANPDEGLMKITSPIVGTFYRAPGPDKDPYVKEGSKVTPESVVCIVEAMKLMNEIQAETSGEIVKIYVENGQPVEYGQPLFGVKQ